MYPHHAKAIENLTALYSPDPDILAIFLAGSVAKGLERPDSDIDAILVVTDERHRLLAAENRLSECVFGHCPYEKGYFDLKYTTRAYLRAAAEHGSEPSRNAFIGARCLFTRDPGLPVIAAAIPVFQQSEKQDKLLSFYSAFRLNTGFFFNSAGDDPYLRTRAAADAVLFGLRLLLEENEVLFPCHKALTATVRRLPINTAPLLEAAARLLTGPTMDARTAFVDALHAAVVYRPPVDYAGILTRYIDDNELWWYKHRPVIAEW